jgi:hypothetical protein
MDEILKDLSDPRWWFNVFFVAILAGLLAGFLKDEVSRWLSRTSAWYRQRKAAALSRQEQQLELLAAQPTLLILHTIHASVTLLFFLFCFGMFLFLPVWTDLMNVSPSFSSWILLKPLPGTDRNTLVSTVKVLIIVLGAISFFTAFVAMSELSVSARAYRRLYDRMRADRVMPSQG